MITHPSTSSGHFSLDDKFLREDGTIYLSGLQALVRLLLDQHRADLRRGLRTAGVVSGYPGSPLGGLDMEVNRRRQLLTGNDIIQIQGLNEDLAATAVFGAQLIDHLPGRKYDGVVGMWFGKAPGVDRSGDAFRHANFRGIGKHGAVLVVGGDDPNAKSSILPSDSTTTFYDLMMPMLYPADVQDVLDLGLHGYGLSRAASLGVGFKIVADVADSAATAVVGPGRVRPVVPEVEVDGARFEPHMQPNLSGRRNLENERQLIQGRLAIASAYARENNLNRVIGRKRGAKVGVVCAGKTYLDVVEALSLLGLAVEGPQVAPLRILKLGQVFPIDAGELRNFAEGLDEVIVVEEKRAFIELFVKDALYALANRPAVVGKRDEVGAMLVAEHGQLTSEAVATVLARRLQPSLGMNGLMERAEQVGRRSQTRPTLAVQRTNYFCSGCPHNTSLRVPEGSVVGGGIGCHTMALAMDNPDFGSITGFTQMGGEGAQWVGAAPFVEEKHLFQNIGDGTLAHSGTQAIRFAIAAGANITYKILYNSAVAMTGGQDVTGGQSVPGLVRLLDAEGVKRIIVTTDDVKKYRRTHLPSVVAVRPREQLLEAERELAATKGVTVLIHDQQCAAEKRRLRKRGKMEDPNLSVFINERVCEGCGDCGKKSNCLSVVPIETEFGRKTTIHQSSCNKDYTCLDGDCPSFMTVKRVGSHPSDPRKIVDIPDVPLPEPTPLVPEDDFSIYMTGVGGTGVVTVDQVLGTAGVIGARNVRTLDLFGGSQKAGPVTSHLRMSKKPLERSNSIPVGGADTLLMFDILAGTEAPNIAKADPERTVAVVSTTKVPTGKMIGDPTLAFPESDVFTRAIDATTRSDLNVYLDAQSLAERLFGDHMATNMILVGAAYQAGALPLPAECIEQAIRLNGAAVETNLNAFRWGRLFVVDSEVVETAVKASQPEATAMSPRNDPWTSAAASWASGELRRLLEIRTADLVAYQDRGYAQSYVDYVKRVADTEDGAGGGRTDLSEAVARNLYKLMAYKDEYEVARLHLETAATAAVKQELGPKAKVYWQLHPPILRALGLKRKIALGPWFEPAFRLLRAMRRLRGSALDPFGHTAMRRLERKLRAEYRATVEGLLPKLCPDNYALLVQIANLPDQVRGYEQVKLDNVKLYRAQMRELVELAAGRPASTQVESETAST